MKLSKRLETVASFVPAGSRLADVGTDHGYIPIFLIQEEKASHAIAMDVREGPLKRALAHIREAGLTEQIEVRLSDGLLELKPEEADCVVIAGMGGELIIHILEEGRFLWDSINHWVLSPHSEIDKVRRFLDKEGFDIRREAMVKEDGKYYIVMGADRKEKESVYSSREIWYRYGRSLLEASDPVLLEYLLLEEKKLKAILAGLIKQQTEAQVRRAEEIRRELVLNKEAQNEMR